MKFLRRYSFLILNLGVATACTTELGEPEGGTSEMQDQAESGGALVVPGSGGIADASGAGGVIGSGGSSGAGGGSIPGTGGGSISGTGGGASSGGVLGEPTPEEIYVTLCADCHGPTGDGIEGEGPDIKHPIRDYAEWVVRNGRGAADDQYGVFSLYYDDDMDDMPVALLSDANLQAIFDFLDRPPQPTTGEGLYEDYCAACHGPDAQGGLTDRPIVEETAAFLENVREGHHPGEFSNRHDHMPAQSAEELSDAEIQLIADYVNSL